MISYLRLTPILLLLACSIETEVAPEAAPAFKRGNDDDRGNGTSDRLDDLERQNAELQAQLAGAIAQIEALRAETTAASAAASAAVARADAAVVGLDAVKSDVYLATADGSQVSRIEALEGALLEIDPVTGEVLSELRGQHGPENLSLHYNKIKWTYVTHYRGSAGSTPGEAIAELDNAVDRVEGDVYLTTGDGMSVSRIEALEGTVLEVDPVTGEVLSDLQDARAVDTLTLHYNKIKWTYAVHGKTVSQVLFGGVPEGASAENASYDRIEALENTLLTLDPVTGAVQSRLEATGYNKIKWTYTRQSRVEDALFPTDPATGVSTDALAALGEQQQKLGGDISKLSATDATFDLAFLTLCGVQLAGSGLRAEDIAARCGQTDLRVRALEDGARSTAGTLSSLKREGDVTRQELASLGYVDAGLKSELEDLKLDVCDLRATTAKVLHGRWDGEYDDGRQPGFWTGLVIDTPDGELSWEDWVSMHFPDTCPV